jgi:hypothetical protein
VRRHVTPSADLRTVDPIGYVHASSPARLLACAVSAATRLPNRTRSRGDTPHASRTVQSVVPSKCDAGARGAVSWRTASRAGHRAPETPCTGSERPPGGACSARGSPAVQHRRESRRQRRQWRAGRGDVGSAGLSPPPGHLCHPKWLPAPRERSRRHRRRRCPPGAVPQVRFRAFRAGRALRSSGPAAGRTAGPAPVLGRGRTGPGRRRGRRPVDRQAH